MWLDTLSHPYGLQEAYSPHGAQAAVIQLQLAEVGQVHPCGATGRRSEADLPTHSPSRLSVPLQPLLVLLPHGFSEAQHNVSFWGQAQMKHAGQGRAHLTNRATLEAPGHWSPGASLEEGSQLARVGLPKLGSGPQPPPKACP